MRFALLTASLWLLPVGALWAGSGRAGIDFLRLHTSPRAVGMGETGTAFADDALTSVSLNPAGLARLSFAEAGFSYNHWAQDVSLQHMVFALPTRRYGSFALNGTLLRTEPIPGFDNAGTQVSNVWVRDVAGAPSYALRVFGPDNNLRLGLFAGASLKYVHSSLDTASASSFMGDAGVLYARTYGPGELSAGLAALNVGKGPQFDQQRNITPAVYRGGVGYRLPVFGDPLSIVFESKRPRDDAFSHSAGFEYTIKNILSWRMGFISHKQLGNGLRFGAGFKLKVLTVDYALTHQGDFGFTHLMGLSARFGETIERTPLLNNEETQSQHHVHRGKLKMKEGRSYEAALEFNEALRLDPHNKEALKLLRKVRDSMETPR